jgi:hypothetical protein
MSELYVDLSEPALEENEADMLEDEDEEVQEQEEE